jgi:mycofactocin glycosyltransferase
VTVPLPVGFRVVLDPSAERIDERTWCGGAPPRMLRLSDAGRDALEELVNGPVATRAGGLLARRLTDAGLAHPRPPAASATADVTVVIPVKDRADLLERCLTSLGHDQPVIVVDDGSADPDRIREVAEGHGARLLRHQVNQGPGAARNTGLAAATTEYVAFLDSDCVATPGWIGSLLPHLADPEVAMVAPRVVPLTSGTWAGRYTRARSALDMGPREGLVAARTRLAYVPSAALLARRSSLVDSAAAVFDPALRQGEDVDLIWRLAERDLRVRYEPAVSVRHVEPTTWRGLLGRRFRNGTSAGPLAARHPGAVPPVVVTPWPAVTVAAALSGSPAAVGAGLIGTAVARRRTLRRNDLQAWAAPSALRLCADAWMQVGRFASQSGGPFALAGLAVSTAVPGRRRAMRRLAAAALIAVPPLVEWVRTRPDLGPARFAAGRLVDDLAYGAGVWAGSLAAHTCAPLRPVISRSKGE